MINYNGVYYIIEKDLLLDSLADQDGAGNVASGVDMQRIAGSRTSAVVAGADHRPFVGIQGQDIGHAGIPRSEFMPIPFHSRRFKQIYPFFKAEILGRNARPSP